MSSKKVYYGYPETDDEAQVMNNPATQSGDFTTSPTKGGGVGEGTNPSAKGRGGADPMTQGGVRGGNGPESEETKRPLFKLPETQTLKGRIEAVLFLTGKALSLAEIAELIEAPLEETELALVELMGDFGFREDSALEIDDTDGYILQVKEEYGDIVNKMMPLEMTAAELRTLSAIAIKAPVLQSDLIEWRGATAYDHIANLLKRKLISKRREGRSYILNVTRNFHEYFKLTADKKDLANLVQLIGKEEKDDSPENAPEDAEAFAGEE